MSKANVKAVTLTTIASSALTSSYQPINTNGLPEACFMIRINSSSSTLITLSYDGINDHEVVLPNQSVNLDFQSNSQPTAGFALMAKGTRVFVKGTAGTGNIYLSAYYV